MKGVENHPNMVANGGTGCRIFEHLSQRVVPIFENYAIMPAEFRGLDGETRAFRSGNRGHTTS